MIGSKTRLLIPLCKNGGKMHPCSKVQAKEGVFKNEGSDPLCSKTKVLSSRVQNRSFEHSPSKPSFLNTGHRNRTFNPIRLLRYAFNPINSLRIDFERWMPKLRFRKLESRIAFLKNGKWKTRFLFSEIKKRILQKRKSKNAFCDSDFQNSTFGQAVSKPYLSEPLGLKTLFWKGMFRNEGYDRPCSKVMFLITVFTSAGQE